MSVIASLSPEEWTILYDLSSSSKSDYELLLSSVTKQVFLALVELIINANLFSSKFNEKVVQSLVSRLLQSHDDFHTALKLNRQAMQAILSYIFLKSITAEIILAICDHGSDNASGSM